MRACVRELKLQRENRTYGAAPRARPFWLLVVAANLLAVGCTKDDPTEDESRTQQESPSGASDDDADDDADDDDQRADDDDDVIDASKPAPGKLDAAVVRDGGAKPAPRIDAGLADPEKRDADSPANSADAGTTTASGPIPPSADPSKDGPYKSTTLQNSGPNGGYTVYLPAELGVGGVKHPIVGWMSGGGTMHQSYPLLPRLATHGFVVIAANVTPGIGQEAMLGMQIVAGIDWAIAENAKQGSKLFGQLATDKIASMGYSMGSLATFQIANDRRLTTTVHISGGNMDPSQVKKLHAPAAFICGNPGGSTCNILSPDCDIAGGNCETDFKNATTPVFYAKFDGGHLGILTAPLSDQIGSLATSWLRWKLFGDTMLDPLFVSDDCTVCKDSKWKVQRKNLP